MNQDNRLEVANLFETAIFLPGKEFSALCAGISQEYAQNISGAVTDYYASLPGEKRFLCSGLTPRESPAIQVTSWMDWRENAVRQRAERYIPSTCTLLADEILYKAGAEYWLTWLDSLPDHEQTSLLLLCGRDLLQPLAYACGMESCANIKTLLFCVLLSKELTPSERESFLDILQKNRPAFLDLCLEVLSDFHFQLAYPQNSGICQSIAAICAGQDALSRLSAIAPLTIGVICAWEEFLSRLNPTEEHLAEFKSAYINWISNTEDYLFTTTMQGAYYNREIKLLEFVAGTYSFDESFETELKTLLEKKTYVYHGWAAEDAPRQQWFLHIGLLLWLIGVNRYYQQRGEELMLYVLEKLNRVIPMVLVNNDYCLLLGNVFCISARATPKIDAQLIHLVQKIFELPILCGITQNYLEHASYSMEVLCVLRERLQILLELPQKKLSSDPAPPAQELLSRIESIFTAGLNSGY